MPVEFINKRCVVINNVRLLVTDLSGLRPDDSANWDSPPDGIPCLCHPKRNDQYTGHKRLNTAISDTFSLLKAAKVEEKTRAWKPGKPQVMEKTHGQNP